MVHLKIWPPKKLHQTPLNAPKSPDMAAMPLKLPQSPPNTLKTSMVISIQLYIKIFKMFFFNTFL